jgi:uncharacterized protein (DUF1501 family)
MSPNLSSRLLTSRRGFLRVGISKVSAAASAAALGHLGRINAAAQATADYKGLVCIFQFGGNDANNTVIPSSSSGYSAYQAVRQSLAIPQASLLAVAGAGGVPYGLHPSLAALHPLYTANRHLALLFNVGTLVRPLTRQQYLQGGQPVPMSLFSHSDQQQQWQNGAPLGGVTTGWCGRVADKVQVFNAGSAFPPAVGVAGNSLQLVGQTTQPTAITSDDFGIDGSDGSEAAVARDAALQHILTLSSGASLIQGANKVLNDAISVARLVDEAVNSSTPFTTVFPATGLGQQLAQVARIIKVRDQLGMKRQIFFCTQGGYDTHSNQLGTHAALLQELAGAMAAFYNAMTELGTQNQVTAFTESEFSRTFQPNGTVGTDHAWGTHQLVLGGAVRGGSSYGTFPTLALQGPDDSGSRGNWIPTTSLDQYGATLASWFGVQPSELPSVFLNLGNFSVPNLGFMS